MKKIFLILLLITPAFSLELTGKLDSNELNFGQKIPLSATITSNSTVNASITYEILEGNATKSSETESRVFNTTITYKKLLSTGKVLPGDFTLRITVNASGETANKTIDFKIKSDCVIFEGLTSAYSLKNQTQTLTLNATNNCEFTLKNVTITLLNSQLTLDELALSTEITLYNVTSPSTSQNARIIATYYGGESRGIIDYRIKSVEEIQLIAGQLINSTQTLLNKSKASLNLVIIGDKKEAQILQDQGEALMLRGVSELNDSAYAMSLKHLTQSAQYFTASNEKSSQIVGMEVLMIVVISVLTLSVMIFLLYNKYKNTVEEKQLEQLGKS